MTASRLLPLLAALLLLAFTGPAAAQDQPADRPTVIVYILAGQSNMEGKGKVDTLPFMAKDPETAPLLDLIRDDNGDWATRDDAFIRYGKRHGKLTVGYGSNENLIGPELTFGTLMAEQHDQPVLIIKTAWGGRSLYKDFRPPSAGMPDDATLAEQLANAQKKKPETTLDDIRAGYGQAYRDMLAEIDDTLSNLDTLFPELANHRVQLEGFVWFQGWNDMVNETARGEYQANMTHFIADVRAALDQPELPFVIAGMGQGGVEASAGMQQMRDAQKAAAEADGHSAYVSTAEHWDPAIAEVYSLYERRNQGLWTDEAQATWATMGSDRAYHYMGAGKIFATIGKSMAEAMVELNR